jgi:cobalamin biosynthesis protein CobT
VGGPATSLSGAIKKILSTFTDGAPVDDSTLSVQGKDFLSDHLNSLVQQLIGIDHDRTNGIG